VKGIAFILFVALAAPAGAAPTANDVKPNLSAYSAYFDGTWSCTGDDSVHNRVAFAATLQVAPSPDGAFVATTGSVASNAYRGDASSASSWVTYDSKANRWVMLGTSSLGTYSVSTSSGWSGDSWKWQETLKSGARPPGSQTITKAGPSRYDYVYTSPGTTARGHCTKS